MSHDRGLLTSPRQFHFGQVKDQSFGFFSPNREPLLEHEQRESFQPPGTKSFSGWPGPELKNKVTWIVGLSSKFLGLSVFVFPFVFSATELLSCDDKID